MRTMPNQNQVNEVLNIWQAIRFRMNERRVTPRKVAYHTGYSLKFIEEGIAGKPAPITLDFLRNFVTMLGLRSGRTRYYEDTPEVLTWDDCVAGIKPPPAMPPRQGNFWEYSD